MVNPMPETIPENQTCLRVPKRIPMVSLAYQVTVRELFPVASDMNVQFMDTVGSMII